jgi:hypothetical protein
MEAPIGLRGDGVEERLCELEREIELRSARGFFSSHQRKKWGKCLHRFHRCCVARERKRGERGEDLRKREGERRGKVGSGRPGNSEGKIKEKGKGTGKERERERWRVMGIKEEREMRLGFSVADLYGCLRDSHKS